jgi:hypothetical protein
MKKRKIFIIMDQDRISGELIFGLSRSLQFIDQLGCYWLLKTVFAP